MKSFTKTDIKYVATRIEKSGILNDLYRSAATHKEQDALYAEQQVIDDQVAERAERFTAAQWEALLSEINPELTEEWCHNEIGATPAEEEKPVEAERIDCSNLEQSDLFTKELVQTAVGIREMHNIKIDVKRSARYGYPEKSLKYAARKLARLVSSGDLEIKQAQEFLKECHDSIEHLILKPVDLIKAFKRGCSEVKKSMKSKLQQYKEFIVESKTTLKQVAKKQRYKMKDIYQGLMFGEPEQKLHNAEGWEKITGVWYLNPNKAFKVVDKIAVEA